ncbi:unnamed protein product [Lactuca virosa]|uniref:Ribulose bisphosphate carboxylase large chain n=1 Tax=Lactuca virosa TaxID=75947 RepID=A0AAU9PFZ7_9ASTR|nr:unnamed protein product [Lactuca virosa]
MSPQIETKESVGFKPGVKDYKLTYYTPEYETKDTDILAAFRVTPQPGVPPEEAGTAVASTASQTANLCLSRVLSSGLFRSSSPLLRKSEPPFRYKQDTIITPPGQLDIQPVIATTQLQERSSTN